MVKLEQCENPVEQIVVESYVNTHSHLRILTHSSAFARLVVQGGADTILFKPNVAGLDDAGRVKSYLVNLILNLPVGVHFIPTMRLTKYTSVDMIDRAVDLGIMDIKVYPQDRTTGSEDGIFQYSDIFPHLKKCASMGVRVHLHPAHPWKVFGDRDAELLFLPIAKMLYDETGAAIILEHGSDARCIEGWKDLAKYGNFFVTITAHHPATNEDQVFGDVRATCQNPIRTERDRLDLVRLIGEDHQWVMAGLDDAPHDRKNKHKSVGRCSCGAYTAPFGLQLYAHALDPILQKAYGTETFINFTSRNARRLYNLPSATRKITLVREPFEIPPVYEVMGWEVEPFGATEKIGWSIK